MEKLLLRPEEAAQMLGIARSRLYQMLRDGHVPFVLIGNKKRVPAEALHSWAKDRAREALQATASEGGA
jgi:excisionase family DNA binding protein